MPETVRIMNKFILCELEIRCIITDTRTKERLELEGAAKGADEGKVISMETTFADPGIELQQHDE